MKNRARHGWSTALVTLPVFLAGSRYVPSASAQNPELQQRVAEIKDSSVKNKQALASKDYAGQMRALAQQYVPPDKDLLQQAFAQGNITMGPTGDAPNEFQLIIRNYLKPQDSMTIVYDKAQKAVLRIQIASYMDDPKDAMNLTVQFSSLRDGTNHVSNLVIDGVSKQLNVAIMNSNYQHV